MPCIFHSGSNPNLYISPPNGDGEAGWYKCHSAKCGISGGVLDEFQERKRVADNEEFENRIDYEAEHKEISKKLIEPEVDPLDEVVPKKKKPKAEPDFNNLLRPILPSYN